MISLIIFSKDRAFQLDALIRSLIINIPNPDDYEIFVLNTYSNELYRKGYIQLHNQNYHTHFKNFRLCPQREFKRDVCQLLQRCKGPDLLFMVDDMVATHPLEIFGTTEYETFWQNDDILTLSLRLGKNLTKQDLPTYIKNDDYLLWDWTQAPRTYWDYPMSVDGHIFRLEHLRPVIPQLDFKAPNSFEGSMVRAIEHFKDKPLMIAYNQSKVFNIPQNKVQTEGETWHGEITAEQMNSMYLQGYQMDVDALQGFANISTHQLVEMKASKTLQGMM